MDLEGHDICKRRAIPVFATPFQALLAAPAPRRRGCRESTTSRPARKLPRATRGASGESLGRFSEIPIAAGRLFGLSTFTHTDNFGAVVLMESRVGTAGSLDLVDGNPIDHTLLLGALQSMRNGEFSVRLPGHWTGLAGKIA